MPQGRLTFMVEMDRTAGSRYSWTDYRYQAPLSIPTRAPRRARPFKTIPVLTVDALGRPVPGRPDAAVPRRPAIGGPG